MERQIIIPNEQNARTEGQKAKSKRRAPIHSEPREFTDIFSDICQMDQKNLTSIERHAVLFCELLQTKTLSKEQVDDFLTVAKQHLQENWLPFLTKVSLELEPHKWGNHQILSDRIIVACTHVLDACSIDSQKLEECSEAFLKAKDERHK